jgi:superfamily II DNA/RNA helicase
VAPALTRKFTVSETRTFADFDVHPDIVAALSDAGIIHPFPIQAMTLPVALSGHDIIGQAKTGTGKTLGFGIPLLQQTAVPGDAAYDVLPAPGKPQALVVVPTRELAVQVARDLEAAGHQRGARVLTVYGGRAYEPQVEALKRGIDVVVGTPGRLLDLAQQGLLQLGYVRGVVLDEADEMLDLGFLPDVEKILGLTPASRQTMLFSATMPGAVVALARRYMTQPTHIRAIDPTDDGQTVAAVEQFVYRAHAMDKVELLARVLQAEGRGLTMIFCRTKRTAAKVADDLADRGFASAAIHGDLGQGAREQAMRAFRNGKVDVLVATDVAARGIDVEDVTHVINYQCPEDEKTYLHRIGRTARAGAEGVAITLVDWDDLHRWALINKTLDLGIPEPQETYSNSDHLYIDLGIPHGTGSTLPGTKQVRAGLAAEEVEDLGETGKRGGPGGRPSRAAAGGRGGSPARSAASSREGGRPHSAGVSVAADQSAPEGRSTRPRNRRRRTRGGSGASPTT